MEYRLLGKSGLKVSALTLGTMTFGGKGHFADMGDTGVDGARRQIDMCLDAGVNLIDTANVYSDGLSEEILGQAIAGRRNRSLIASKARFASGDKGLNDSGLSRHHLVRACEASLRRLGTDHIDIYWLHAWDGQTPLEETLRALDDLTRQGKIGYVGVSNFSGWHLMKMLAIAEREGLVRPVGQQIFYTLTAREAEYELIPVALDQGVDVVVWSPLAGGLLSGKFRRGQPDPEGTRKTAQADGMAVRDVESLYDIVDVLTGIAERRGATAAQVALAWLLTRPAVASVVVGARTEAQLADNLNAAEIHLADDEIERLEQASRPPLIYPYWHQKTYAADRLSAADLALIAPHFP